MALPFGMTAAHLGDMPERTARGEATRRRIVEAARDLVHAQGVAATSVDAILARARAGKSQFYHYFHDRNDLMLTVAVEAARELLATLLLHLEDPGGVDGVVEWLRASARSVVERGLAGGCPLGSMAAEVADRNESLRRELDAAFAAQLDHLETHFGDLVEARRLAPSVVPAALAAEVVTSLQGGLLLAKTTKRAEHLDAAIEGMARRLRALENLGGAGSAPAT